ncbi:MAG: excinuclease ABC subunit UvrC [Betaproteobacteria bacterium]|nr:excinuclease ABC subunit UvrC [Betaproteobacteria bacterium]
MGAPVFDSKAVVAGLPGLPGVYRMLNREGQVIYVGKAKDLKKRVASYFQKGDLSPRIQRMVTQVAAIETTVTRSESEALILENNLIKALTPRYNILFRDDKSYPYIVVTGHRYPRLGFHRGPLDKTHRYFGPFPSAWAVRESLQLLQKAFRLRTCEDTVFSNRARPCLLYQIRRCTAPCVNLVSPEAYREDVENAVLFLGGKRHEVIRILTAKMERAAAGLNYEDAAVFRDQIQTLAKVQERQFVSSGKAVDADVVACATEAGRACVNLVMIRGGLHVGDKSFLPDQAEGSDAAQLLEAFLAQHYVGKPAPCLIIAGARLDGEALEALLSEQAGYRVQIIQRPAGERREWLAMAEENARLALAQRLSEQASQEGRLQALQQALELDFPVSRVECFDISHIFGEATVGSCVVFDHLAMQKGEYRRYNIAQVRPGDDYAAMREVLHRRYSKIAGGEGKLPDLILIDGGRGQLGVVRGVLADLGVNGVALVGVAKGEGRKPGLEQLFFPDRGNPLQLPKDHPGLHLIQQIRDEAHRFAIQGHRVRRGKARTTSVLEQIGGVGAKRRQRLLARFGGLKGVLNASVDELTQVDGISRALAERIFRELH